MLRTRLLRWVVAVALLGQAPPVLAASFTPIPDVRIPRGLSGDGSTIVGYGFSPASGSNSEALRWSQATGVQWLGDLPGGSYSSNASAASADGSVVVGLSIVSGQNAFRWTELGGMVGLGTPAGYPQSSAADVSADGSVIVGRGDTFSSLSEAFRWTEVGGFELLGVLPGRTSSRAIGVSADGSVVAGASSGGSGSEGFVWTAETGMISLGAAYADPRAISADGSTIVGLSISTGFRWTEAEGMVDLGSFRPTAVSGDGSILAGTVSIGGVSQAFYSHPLLGLVSLQSLLQNNYDLDLSGWTLSEVAGISDDGFTLVGRGSGPNGTQTWIATLEVPEASTGTLLALGLSGALVRGKPRRSVSVVGPTGSAGSAS